MSGKQSEYNKPLQVRVSEEQYELFKRAARTDGRTLSGWARQRLFEVALAELGERAPQPTITTSMTQSTAVE